MKLPDAVRRALRTFVQAFIGVILAQSGAILIDAQRGEYVLDLDWIKRILVSALVAAVIALITWIQNYLEDNTGVPAIGKATASSGENPITQGPAV
jgi:hypothetical protein